MILDKAKFLFMALIFSLTANTIQLVKIKDINSKLLVSETKRVELQALININQRTYAVQKAEISRLKLELASTDTQTQLQIARIANLPDSTSCTQAIKRGLLELNKRPIVSDN